MPNRPHGASQGSAVATNRHDSPREAGPDRLSADQLRKVAAASFGIEEFREGQIEAMQAVADRDVLAVMPTGHGKSAIYQVPGMALPGTALVVSPLIALQQDQVEAINDGVGEKCAYAVNSKSGVREERAAWAAVGSGKAKFLFLAPEQLAREETIERLRQLRLSLFVVDEAHCISAWGHDFRPDYLSLGPTLERLGHPPVMALTATASPQTRAEIVDRLGMHDPFVIVHSFDRPNIHLRVVRHHADQDKRQAVTDQVAALPGPGLVYVATRKSAADYAGRLAGHGLRTEPYHAGRKKSEREDVHTRFLAGDLDVVVATTAFGMGIDKPDVRFVVHADIPESLDSYYQEIGRAGRDSEPAVAVLHYRSEDVGLRQFFTTTGPDEEDVAKVLHAVLEAGPIRAARLRDLTGMKPRAQARVLNLLEHSGSIVSHRARFRAVDGISSRVATEKALETAESQRLIARSRVEMARGYAETESCRRAWLLHYFGEEAEGWCSNCDRCEQEGSEAEARQRRTDTPSEWQVQTSVRHRDWGAGLVMSAEPDRITVLFDSVGYKQLALTLVEEQEGLLVQQRPDGNPVPS